jgi:hypothetical protein
MSPQDATEIAPQAAVSPANGRKLGLALLVIATAQPPATEPWPPKPGAIAQQSGAETPG